MQVLINEVGAVSVVGDDAAHLRRGDEDVLRLLPREERPHRGAVGEFQLGMPAQHEIAVPGALERAHQGGADEASVARNVDLGALLHQLSARRCTR